MTDAPSYWQRLKEWILSFPLPFFGTRDERTQSRAALPPASFPVPDEFLSTRQYEGHASRAYMSLKMLFRDIGRLHAIAETLGRDFLTAMPDGAYKSRLGQISFLYRRMHEELANDNLQTLIGEARQHQKTHASDWDEWDSANLREMENMYRHVPRVSADLMERKARLAYEGRPKHRDVFKVNDWDEARPFLEDMVDLQCQIAEARLSGHDKIEGEDPLYQALMADYVPGVALSDVDVLFSRMEEKLKEILPWIIEDQGKLPEPVPLIGPFDAACQQWLNKSLLSSIGFDFDRGGLFETGHNPVEGGTPDDTRLVIKTANTSNFMEGMKSALHEGGHGLYIQGLPRDTWRYQPVAQDLGAAVQESQALLVEMILGRTKEFFHYLAPRVEGLFQKFGDPAMTASNLYALKTRVKPTLDRKSADEVTYFFHILLRMRLERDLIARRLKVKDLPEAWNAGMKDLLGIEPQSYAQGCLQDVHWFVGKFGYFPAYTLGHMMAAQFHDAMKQDIQNIPHLLSAGEFAPIHGWLLEKVYKKGRLHTVQDLLTEVTGEPLSPGPLINHLQDRYLAG